MSDDVTRQGQVSVDVTRHGQVSVDVTRHGQVSVDVTRQGQVSVDVTRQGQVSVDVTRRTEAGFNRFIESSITRCIELETSVIQGFEMSVDFSRHLHVDFI